MILYSACWIECGTPLITPLMFDAAKDLALDLGLLKIGTEKPVFVPLQTEGVFSAEQTSMIIDRYIQQTKELVTTLTDEEKEKEKEKEEDAKKQQFYYDNGGNLCPYCHSNDIEGGSLSVDSNVDSNVVKQEMWCNNCDLEWNDLYNFVKFQEV